MFDMSVMQSLRRHARWYIWGVLFIAVAGIWYAVSAEAQSDVLTVAFLDVGQGDAIFIETPSGAQMLIDGGAGRAVLRELGKAMPFYDRSIDIVLATHPDQDHIGGLPDVIGRYDVSYFVEPGVANDTAVYHSLMRELEEEGAPRVYARRGMQVQLGGGAVFDVLFPDRDVSGLDPNEASIIGRLTYGDTSFLFTGDASKSIEEYLVLLDQEALDTDVLKVGHHGSKTSTARAFVGAVSPEYAVISAGRDNRYGHPHQDVLDTLAEFDVEVFTTAEDGTVIFVSDGENLKIK